MLTSTVLLICPESFESNVQTIQSNVYQKENPKMESQRFKVKESAKLEFKDSISRLTSAGIDVIEISGNKSIESPTPGFFFFHYFIIIFFLFLSFIPFCFQKDEVFPNNWISTDKTNIILYPMMAENRRRERRQDVVDLLKLRFKNSLNAILDLSFLENNNHILEGTGSLVLDRDSKVAYACLSPRTTSHALSIWNSFFPQYQIVTFRARQKNADVYHTNVVMAVGISVIVICLESIVDENERTQVRKSIEINSKKKLVEISLTQMAEFAGNMLQLKSKNGNKLWVMSETANNSLSSEQRSVLQADGSEILTLNIKTIEDYGGGSARCMLAEIFL